MRLEADVEVARARQIDRLGHDDVSGPRAHDMNVIGEERRFAQVMRDQDHGEAELLPQVAQHAPQFVAREGVERGERLVEHQQRRLMDQCAAERDALLHAAGELPRKTLGEAVEPDGLEQCLGLVAVVLPLASELAAVRLDDLERQEHVVDDLAPGQEIRVLERHAGDLDRPAYPIAENDDVPGIGGHEPGHDLHQRRLAAARGPHHRGEFATGDVKARVPQGVSASARTAGGQLAGMVNRRADLSSGWMSTAPKPLALTHGVTKLSRSDIFSRSSSIFGSAVSFRAIADLIAVSGSLMVSSTPLMVARTKPATTSGLALA